MSSVKLLDFADYTGLQAFSRFISTLQPKNNLKEIWLKLGSELFFTGNWDSTGNFEIKTSKKIDGDKDNRVTGKRSFMAWEHLNRLSREADSNSNEADGVYYLPTQPIGKPLQDCVTSTDTLACEFDAGTFEEQHKRYSEFVQITGLNFSSLVGSGGKSIHAYLKLIEHLPLEQVDYLRKLFVIGLISDPIACNLWQPMRVPGFLRVKKNKEQILHYFSNDRYSYDQVLEGLKKWFEHCGFVLPLRLPGDYWSRIKMVLSAKNYSDFENKSIAVKECLTLSVDEFEQQQTQVKFTRDQYKESFTADGFYDSVFNQAIGEIEKVNKAAEFDDFDIINESFESNIHARCLCPFHESSSKNSGWINYDENFSSWVFHCPTCTDNKPIAYSEFWRYSQVETEGDYLAAVGIPKMPTGDLWWKFVKSFLTVHKIDTKFLDTRKEKVLIPLAVYDIYWEYFDNYKDQKEALDKILLNISSDIISDRSAFITAMIDIINGIYLGDLIKIDECLDRIKTVFNLKSSVLNQLNKKSSNTIKREKRIEDDNTNDNKSTDLREELGSIYKGDYLFNEFVLENVFINSLTRVEEGASGVYKWYVNAPYIFNLFTECYKDRILKRLNKKGESSYLFYGHIDDTKAYKWSAISLTGLHSKVWIFARRLLRFVSMTDNDFDSMINRCNDCFKIEFNQQSDAIQIDLSSKYYENTEYRPYKNGLYDLTAKRLIKYHPSIFNTTVLPYNYIVKPSEDGFKQFSEYFLDAIDCSTFVTKDRAEIHQFCMDAFGLAVLGKAAKLKSFLWLVGESNRGKTSFIKTLNKIIDPSLLMAKDDKEKDKKPKFLLHNRAYSESPKNLLELGNRFKNSVFRYAYLIMMDDKNGLTNDQVSELKSIVSVDSVLRDEDKGDDTLGVFNRSLIIFTSEKDPQISCVDAGGVNRLVLVDFNPTDITLHDNFNQQLEDFSFRENLDSYIVNNFDVDAIAQKYRVMPEAIKKRQSKFKEDNDPVTQFFSECLDFSNPAAYEVTTNLHKLYGLFDENCIKFKTTDRNIGKRLNPHLETKCELVRTTLNKITGRYCIGVRIKSWEEIEEYLHFKDDQVLNRTEMWISQRVQGVKSLTDKTDEN